MMFWWDMLPEVGFGASLYRRTFAHALQRIIVLITKVCLYDILFLPVLSVYNINKKLQQTTKNTFGPGTHFPDDQSIRI